MSEQPQIKLIVVSTSPESAKRIAGAVGRMGYVVKGKLANSSDTLHQLLKSQPWDVVLVAEQLPPEMGLEQITSVIRSIHAALPVIAVYSQVDEARRTIAMQAGARDAVSITHPELLGLILKREIEPSQLSHVAEDTPPETTQAADADSYSKDEELWINRIKQALANNRFTLVYQPIVNLNAEPRPSYELLLRMLDEDGSEIPPGAFLQLAEKSGLITEIDRWVIDKAIATLLERQKEDQRTRFFVKLSTASILDNSLAPSLSEQLRRAKLPEQSLVFEITEAAALAHTARATALIQQLKQLHCLVALDHVASTGASLSTAPDFIKISGQLIRNISTSATDKELLAHIVGYARSQNIMTIAQSVQDAGTLAYLWQWGINYIQGYYLQRPDGDLHYDFEQKG